MRQPPGFEYPKFPTYICKLKRAIYGLKQASRAWYIELKNYLLFMGFSISKSDDSLFIFHSYDITVYILVYMDDIIITGSHTTAVRQVIQGLSSRFSLKDMGLLNYFLGVQVLSYHDGIILSQAKYIQDLLTETKMIDYNSVSTPMSPSLQLTMDNHAPLLDITSYRRLLGKLQYLSFTRPDLSFAVNKLSQFMHCPQQAHWQAVKHLLRYLKGTSMYGLKLDRRGNNCLLIYSDSDWGGDPSDRSSTSGYVVYHGSNPICWSSKK